VSSKLGEIAGYAGAALVVAAGVVFIAQEWSNLTDHWRVAWIAAMGVVLAVAGIVASFLGTGFAGLQDESGAVRRRLAGTFYTGTAISFASATGVEGEHLRSVGSRDFNSAWIGVAAFAMLALIGLIVHFAGAGFIHAILPPAVTGAVVMLIGFNLAPVVAGIYWPQDQWVALATATFMVFAAVVLPGSGRGSPSSSR